MPQTYITREGVELEVPDDPTDQEKAYLRSVGAKPEKWGRDFLKSVFSGVTEGAVRAPLIAGDVIKLGLEGVNKLGGDKDNPIFDMDNLSIAGIPFKPGSDAVVDELKQTGLAQGMKKIGADPFHEPETRIGRYGKAGASAVSGGTVLGALGSLRHPMMAGKEMLNPAMTAINAASGVAGEVGLDASRKFDETQPGNPLVGTVASIVTSLAGNAVRQSRMPNANQNLHDATRSMRPEDWAAAEQSLARMKQTGADSLTLADVPELQPRIGGLAQGVSNTTGGDVLRQKLSTQARHGQYTADGKVVGDIPKLLKNVVEDVSPKNVKTGTWSDDIRKVALAVGTKASQAGIPGVTKPMNLTPDSLVSFLNKIPEDRLLTELKAMAILPEEARTIAAHVGSKLVAIPRVGSETSKQMMNRRLFEKLVEYVDPNLVPGVRNKMTVADSLARLSAEHATDRTFNLNMSKNAVGTIMAPFGETRFRAGLGQSAKETKQLGDLISNPTAENLQKLRALAEVDPRARRALEWVTSIAASFQSQGSSRDQPGQ